MTCLAVAVGDILLHAFAITHASLWHAMKATSAGSGCFPADGRQLPLSIVSCSIQD